MARCEICGSEGRTISGALGVCAACLRAERPGAMGKADAAHRACREEFGLPVEPPRSGALCGWCANNCRIPEGERGFCGVRRNRDGTLHGGTGDSGRVTWYHDPLPTNCVADWVCAGSGDQGRTNLAVFYESCSFDCLFCQNWHYRDRCLGPARLPARSLADAADERTGCICYFGGDPSTQVEHALAASRLAIERAGNRPLRICWETNGAMARRYLEQAAELSLATGGCIKFDLKAWSPSLHRALCGITNKPTLDNFAWLAEWTRRRPEPPLLVASTLLVPGYVEVEEVAALAAFIAKLDPSIPYSLLGFHPDFYMADLPCTSRRHAEECREAALDAGLQRVRIGNRHILGSEY